ncbi:MAG: ABC transporter ATP-binding protein [Candidatus Hecatellales archaeon]|nr:MAG: ABC transporter ATP-binding protein [Candidatus Hecatellales archaeon]
MILMEDVWFRYEDGTEALRGVTLQIEDNSALAVMGKSGSGKTTLIKHLNGLLKPVKGRVLVDGMDTREATVAQLSRKVGLVFQNPDHQLFAETVEEEIAFPLKNFGFPPEEIEKRVDWALNLLDLADYRHDSPLSLSGGEKKRVAIASVVAWKPKYLVLDEPTLGQDYGRKLELKRLFEKLRREGHSIIMVTHDVEFAAECKFKVALLVDGQILALGPAEEILSATELLKKASLTAPQLVELFQRLEVKPPVFEVEEAERFILKLAGKAQP